MSDRLLAEIKQTQPFTGLEEEAMLNLVRTVDVLSRAIGQVIVDQDLTPTQYNVLRILRGARGAGITCGQIGERLVRKDPDVTRLIDRLEARGWTVRERDPNDRRVVRNRITRQGMDLLAGIDQPLAEAYKRTLGHMGKARLRQLIEILEEMRDGLE